VDRTPYAILGIVLSPGRDRARRHGRGGLAVLVAALMLAPAAIAARPIPPLPPQIPPTARVKVQPVTDNPSLATSVEGEPFVGRRDVFEYLLDHPEFATHVTRSLRFARYRIWRTAEGLAIDDGWGTKGTFEIVYSGAGTRVIYARGVYEQRILPDIPGQAVVVIDYGMQPAPDGRFTIRTTLTGFVKLDGRLLSLAGKLASTVARAKADKEAKSLARLFMKTTRAIEDNPAAVYESVRQRPDVPQRELEEFRRLLNVSASSAGPGR
jgi:hypothetical protein